MLSNSNVATELLQLARRRPQLHGEWIPVVYWAKKLQRSMGGSLIHDKKIQKIMEKQGLVGLELDDGLMLEFLTKNVYIADRDLKRLFVCFSTTLCPLTVLDSRALAAACQKSWNLYAGEQEVEDEEQEQEQEKNEAEDEDLMVRQQSTESPTDHSSPVQSRVTPPTISTSPVLQDNDILSLFRSLINPKYLSKDDLFVDNCCSPADVRSKLFAFGTNVAAKSNNKHYQRVRQLFKDDETSEFEQENINNIPTEDFPFFTERCGLPTVLRFVFKSRF